MKRTACLAHECWEESLESENFDKLFTVGRSLFRLHGVREDLDRPCLC